MAHLPACMHVACLHLDTDWLTGIEINYNNQKYVILCVYMPYESHDHEDLFLEHLDTLKAIIEDLNTTCISIVGDWNSAINDIESVL